MKWIIWTVIILAVLPLVIVSLYKPSRAFVPSLFGVTCSQHEVCIDDESRRTEAVKLYEQALRNIQLKLGSKLSYSPRVIFCASQSCFESFGFKKASAQTLGTIATIIGPKGWKSYYLEHELIHQWQSDKLGSISMYLAPQWITEGMAYALSSDPRPELTEPWNSDRKKFLEWYEGIDQANLIKELKNAI